MRNSVTHNIIEEIGVLSEKGTGWKKEINLISWNGGDPKIDIREWDPEHVKMSRGVTLTHDEMRTLIDAYQAYLAKPSKY